MRRKDCWEKALDEYLTANRNRPFVYGSWDCFQLLRGAVSAMTGVDLMARFQPYQNMIGAMKQMLRYCESASLLAFGRQLLESAGAVEISGLMARRGDAVIAGNPPAFGIVALNAKSLVMLDRSGQLLCFPRTLAICAWRI